MEDRQNLYYGSRVEYRYCRCAITIEKFKGHTLYLYYDPSLPIPEWATVLLSDLGNGIFLAHNAHSGR